MKNISEIKGMKNYKNYFIDKNGILYTTISKSGKPIKDNSLRKVCTSKNKAGYITVRMNDGNGSKTFLIHRLVALAFIPNPENKPTVDHIDRNRTNNNVDNLRWATMSEQNNNKAHNIWNAKKVINIDTGEIYDNARKASDAIGIKNNNVARVCKRYHENKNNIIVDRTRPTGFKRAGGYRWAYLEDYN